MGRHGGGESLLGRERSDLRSDYYLCATRIARAGTGAPGGCGGDHGPRELLPPPPPRRPAFVLADGWTDARADDGGAVTGAFTQSDGGVPARR